MRYTMADRLKARCKQLGVNAGQLGEIARVNRSFVYDIMRGKSENPNLERLDRLAAALKVERNWLLHGMGEVEGEAPILENPDEAFVAVPYVSVRPSMGGGNLVEEEPATGRPYHFQRSWIKQDLKAEPVNLRIMHVEGDSMMPTLRDGDVVVWESHAIVRYLAATYGASSLWPVDPRERAETDKWTDWTATTFQPAWLAVFEAIVRTPETRRDPVLIARAEAAANRLYGMLDRRLADCDFIGGDRPTYADIVAGASMFRWMTMPHERPALPHLEAWHGRLMARPAFVKAVCVDFSDMYGAPLPAPPN